MLQLTHLVNFDVNAASSSIAFIKFYDLVKVFSFCISVSSDGREKDNRDEYEEPYVTAYLHSHERPNEFNCTDRKHITLGMTTGQNLDHRKYTFFLSPE